MSKSELRNRKGDRAERTKGEEESSEEDGWISSTKARLKGHTGLPADRGEVRPFSVLNVGCVSVLEVNLNKGEMIRAESNALVTALPAKVSITASTNGGLFQAVSRSLAGESFFLQEMRAQADDVKLELAPKALHHLAQVYLSGDSSFYVRQDGFFAAQDRIKCSGKVAGVKEWLAQSLALLEITGEGWFVVEAFGGVKKVEIPEGKTALIDNSHLVAWPSYAHYDVRQAGETMIDSILSGEMAVLKFRGPVTIYVSYAREGSIEGRVSTQNQTSSNNQTGLNLGMMAGRLLSQTTSVGQGNSAEGAVKGFFKGMGMVMILFFIMCVMLPRLFF